MLLDVNCEVVVVNVDILPKAALLNLRSLTRFIFTLFRRVSNFWFQICFTQIQDVAKFSLM